MLPSTQISISISGRWDDMSVSQLRAMCNVCSIFVSCSLCGAGAGPGQPLAGAGALHCLSDAVRPVAAQQFNVLRLGGEHLYWGERWQSTPTGLKADDFSYMEPLRFDADGVMQRMKFTPSFELSL